MLQNATLGPRGVVRFKYDIGEIRPRNLAKYTDEDNSKEHSQRILKRYLRRAAVALRKWQARQSHF